MISKNLLKDNKGYLTLIDFFSLYYSRVNTKFTKQLKVEDVETGSLFNILRSYFKVIRDFDNPVLCFDYRTGVKEYNPRLQTYEKYKYLRRQKRSEEYKKAYDWLKIFLSIVPYVGLYYDGYEGDDIIFSVVIDYQLNVNNIKNKFPYGVIILTVDSDLWYLKKFKNVYVIDLKGYEFIDLARIKKKYDILNPEGIMWLKLFHGDTSDNIPSAVIGNKSLFSKKIKSLIDNNQLPNFIDVIKDCQSNNYYDCIKVITLSEIESILKEYNLLDYINFEQLKINYELILFRYININDVKLTYRSGNEKRYVEVCNEYKFRQVPDFKQYKDLVDVKLSKIINKLGLKFKIGDKNDGLRLF